MFLPFLNGLTACSRASDVDGAGQTVVGFSGIYGESHAVLWGLRHPSGSYELADLGVLAGFEASGALGISQNGRVVVGSCYRVDGDNFESTAFLWDRRQGMRDVRKALLDAGVPGLEGWTLLEASAVSENGEWVCGTARNADWDIFGWVARMP